ncbi:MAG: methyltransferase domain-containing protein [Nitrospirae bacterium]|nr:methyltransferase domain-containing protein [Nitrospirota bacterium]
MVEYRAKRKYQNSAYAAGYDRIRYGGISGYIKNRYTLDAVDKVLREIKEGGLVLDVPCGTGRLVPLFAGRSIKWLGADISFEMMEVARRRPEGINNRMGNVRLDSEHMPFKSASFDCVASIRFIYHVPTGEGRIAMLREMARVSKKWVIVDYNYPNPIKSLFRRIGYLIRTPKMRRRLSVSEICGELEKADLKVCRKISVSKFFSDNVVFLCSRS